MNARLRSGSCRPFLLTAALLLFCTGAYAAPSRPLSKQDQTWLKKAHQVNLAEIKAGGLAETKGHANSIQMAGHTLASDHAMLDAKLKPAAQKLRVQLPHVPNAEQKNHMKVFTQSVGLQFDKSWAHIEIGGHILAIEATRKEITDGSSPEVKKLANKALPVLMKHLQLLKRAELEIHGGG